MPSFQRLPPSILLTLLAIGAGAAAACAPVVVGGGGGQGAGSTGGARGAGTAGASTVAASTVAASTVGAGAAGVGGSGSTVASSGAGGGVAGPESVARLRAGGDDTCVVTAAGHVACWGDSEVGQLGLGDFNDRRTPAWIPGLDHVVDLALADFSMCARRSDGSVWCWGMNDAGELDAATATCPGPGMPYECSAVPVLAAVQGAGPLSGDYKGFCTAGTAGSVTCWGAAPYVDATGYDALGVALGDSHACVRFQPAAGQSGSVVCFGAGGSGQLGTGMAQATAPVVAPGAGTLVEIAAGADFTLAVDAAGNLFSWGANWAGALGVGFSQTMDIPENCPSEGACSTAPVPVGGLPPIAHVAAYDEQVCASTTGGQVYCWGTASLTSPASVNGCYLLNTNCTPNPVLVAGVANATAIAVGYGHACALTGPLEVTCWGLDTHGQLGRGPGPDWDPTPVAVTIGPEPM